MCIDLNTESKKLFWGDVELCEKGYFLNEFAGGLKWGKVDKKWTETKPVPCTTGIVVRHKACRASV